MAKKTMKKAPALGKTKVNSRIKHKPAPPKKAPAPSAAGKAQTKPASKPKPAATPKPQEKSPSIRKPAAKAKASPPKATAEMASPTTPETPIDFEARLKLIRARHAAMQDNLEHFIGDAEAPLAEEEPEEEEKNEKKPDEED